MSGRRKSVYGVIVLVVVVAFILALINLVNLSNHNKSENVSFIYQAKFVYCASESNLPIDNVVLRFPCPNVENDVDVLESRGVLTLFWMDDNKKIFPEIIMHSDGTIIQVSAYYGNRKENLKVILSGIASTIYGPKIYYNFDRLYPGEGILIDDLVFTPNEIADKVTLTDTSESNRVSAYYSHQLSKVEFIEFSFQVSLQKEIDNTFVLIETYSRSYENGIAAWYTLYP